MHLKYRKIANFSFWENQIKFGYKTFFLQSQAELRALVKREMPISYLKAAQTLESPLIINHSGM